MRPDHRTRSHRIAPAARPCERIDGGTVRATLFALIAAEVAAVGHLVGGGSAPDLPLLAGMSALLVCSLRPLSDRRAGFAVLLGTMGGTQVVFHWVSSLAGAPHSHAGSGWRMWLFHAAAAVVSATVLAYGERLAVSLATWRKRRRPAAPPRPQRQAETPSGGLPRPDVPVRRGARIATRPATRRGPPHMRTHPLSD